uniref:Retrotransposon gag domain-containing protein n=9 Tax=Nymphaea colorata TaxID=210225 RepID=A0A5K1GCD8_9MAGN
MVETRSQSRRRSEMELDQPFIGDRGEESSSETPPKLEINDPEFEEYRRFRKYMIMFNEEQAQAEKAKKKGKKTRKYSSSSSDSSEDATTESSSEEEPKTPKKKKKGESWKTKIQEVEKKLNAVQLKGKNKRNFTCEDFYESFENDKHIKNLPNKFIKFDGHGDPKAHLAMFFAECYKFRHNHRALFRCFPRSLEGIAAQWYREHINPVELKNFDMLINLFIERFIQNVETAPTITTLCYLKQRPGEKVRDFIQRWRSSCNKMRDPISQSHALGLIVNNLTQPLRSLISNAPIKSFIDLTERAECIEAGIENGAFDAVIPVKVREDTKKNSRSQNAPANIVANAAAFKKEKSEYPKNKGVMDKASGSSSGTKNKHPGWGYDRKFTPLQQSYEEVMHMLIERGTLFLPKVSNPPPMMGKNKEQFCKFHRAPGHDTEDCLVLKNIVQDAVDKEIIKEVSEQPDILKNPFPKHGKGIVSMVRFSTGRQIMVTNKRDTASLDFFGLLFKHDKGSINAQTGLVKQDHLTEIDQKSQVCDPEPLESIFNELDPLPEVKKGGFSPNRGNEWAFELCENSPIIFSDKDLPTGGASHNDALHIVIETRGTRVSHVLIDGGASLNICPQQTARELGIRQADYTPSKIFIHGYDGTGQPCLGCICLDLNISETYHRVLFHVVDIEPSFNLLLGRPWIHATNAVPSTLHQCVKWTYNGNSITIYAEDRESRLVHPMIPVPTYTIEVPSIRVCKEEEISQSLSRLAIQKPKKQVWVKRGTKLETSYKSHPLFKKFCQNEKGLDLLIRHDYQPFTGLGKHENGILEPVTLTGQRGTQALGCQSYEKVDVEEEFKPVPFVKSNTIGGCSPSI